MAYTKGILLGKIVKVSGYEGAVAIRLEKFFTENIPEMESVFLEIEGRPVPFLISGIEYGGADNLKLTFEGYNSAERISEFVGCRVFLGEKQSPGSTDNEVNALEGYIVVDKDDNAAGTITGLISNNGQWLLEIESSAGRNLLIPLHEDLIININRKKKILKMDIPDGLLEIN